VRFKFEAYFFLKTLEGQHTRPKGRARKTNKAKASEERSLMKMFGQNFGEHFKTNALKSFSEFFFKKKLVSEV